jgi:hypothetical protein
MKVMKMFGFPYHLKAMGRIRSLLVASIMRAITSTSCVRYLRLHMIFKELHPPNPYLKKSINRVKSDIYIYIYKAHPLGIFALISTLP